MIHFPDIVIVTASLLAWVMLSFAGGAVASNEDLPRWLLLIVSAAMFATAWVLGSYGLGMLV